jgi:hypothetical protein
MKEIENIILKRELSINEINDRRRRWLYASSLVFFTLVVTIFKWPSISDIHEPSIWWVVVAVLLVVSVNWWYWTLHVINTLLENQRSQIEVLKVIIDNLHEIEHDINDDNKKGA